jgi:hypothetical protein
MRRYHESDCPKLEKWVCRAKLFGHLKEDAILAGLGGEFIPPESGAEAKREAGAGVETEAATAAKAGGPERPRIELLLSRPDLAPLVLSVCQKRGVGLVSVEGRRAAEMAERLIGRARGGGLSTPSPSASRTSRRRA